MAKDFYNVLGIARGATADEIKRAYRKLAREYHPDVNKNAGAAAKFTEVQEAYDVLSDPQKREYYDRFGHAPGSDAGAAPGGMHVDFGNMGGFGNGGGMGGGRRVRVENFDFDAEELGSMFDAFFGGARGPGRPGGGGGSGGGGGGGGGNDGGRTRARGRTHQRQREPESLELFITFMTAARGGTEQVKLEGPDGPRTLEVKIPAGVVTGQRLRVRGSDGDVTLELRVGEHPTFRRAEFPGVAPADERRLDLYVDVGLDLGTATLGGPVSVPTLTGSVELRVPPGTPSGAKLRAKGQGISPGNGPSGDLYAVIKIVPPRDVPPDLRAALERLRPGDARASEPMR